MPTVGWIVEDALDRFWEAQPAPAAIDLPPQQFLCGLCGERLPSVADLRRHYSSKHPLELPGLYLRGEPVLRESAVRSKVSEKDIELMQCTGCQVQIDGGTWRDLSPSQFKAHFVRAKSSTWNVRLLHERAADGAKTHEEYHVRFRVPETSELSSVDKVFISVLVKYELTHADLARFQSHLPEEVAAREYGAALGDYALAILLKERRETPHSQVAFDEFARKMRASLAVLVDFNRVVAMAVCGTIRFNLNDFDDYGTSTPVELEPGLQFFRHLTGKAAISAPATPERTIARPRSRHAICPIDQVSHQLLAICAATTGGKPFTEPLLQSLNKLLHEPGISEQDLAKIRALSAAGYLSLGRDRDARPHLLAVQFHPVFKDWAQGPLNSAHEH